MLINFVQKSSLVEQPNKKRKGKAEQNGTTTAPKERKNSGRKPKNTQAEVPNRPIQTHIDWRITDFGP